MPDPPEPRPPSPEAQGKPGFVAIYDRFSHEVSRWVRALGGLEADIDDLTQEVFLVVRRKLAAFDGRDLPSWLYRITARTVSDYRRRAWFRNLFHRVHGRMDDLAGHAQAPDILYERKEARRLLSSVLDRMSPTLREAFALFEIEGYAGREIARLLGIPEATVWTRLHKARKRFVKLVSEISDPEEVP